MDLFIPRRDDEVEESLAGFVRRRLGREALERLVQPLVGGHLHGRPQRPEPEGHLPQFLAMEREHRSLILAGLAAAGARNARTGRRRTQASGARYGMFVTLADGMDVLPEVAGRRAPAGLDPDRIRPSAGSAATSRSRPGWSSCWTARRWRPTPWS